MIRNKLSVRMRADQALIVLAICCFFLEDITDLGDPGNLTRLGLCFFAASFLFRRHTD